MAQGKNKIFVYRDWLDNFKELSDEELGVLMRHFFEYVNDLDPVLEDRLLKVAWRPIEATLKRDLAKWQEKSDKNSESAKKRWDKNNANASERKKRNANDADRDSVSDRDSVRDTDKKTIDEIYLLYPSKCVVKGSSTGKGSGNKDQIKRLLKKHSSEHLKKTIGRYIKECQKHQTFMKNFKTFLNDLPDYESEDTAQEQIKSVVPSTKTGTYVR